MRDGLFERGAHLGPERYLARHRTGGDEWQVADKRAFDLGCGHGMVAKRLSQLGFRVSGVDSWAEGIAIANRAMPDLALHVGSVYDNLAGKSGTFPLVISTEVVEIA